MNLGFLKTDGIKNLAKSAWAFGKKNSASFAAGGGMALSWIALIMMMFEAPKAAEAVKEENERREDEDLSPMTKTETVVAYASKCWPAFACEGVGTALEVYAHKDLLSTVSQMYIVSQLYKEDGENLRKQILKEDGGEKKLEEYRSKISDDAINPAEITKLPEYVNMQAGETLIKDNTTGNTFTRNMGDLRSGFDDFNQMAWDRWTEAYKKALREKNSGKDKDDEYDSAFWSQGDKAWRMKGETEEDAFRKSVYVKISLDEFLTAIGEKEPHTSKSDIGEICEFVYYGNGPAADFNKIVDFKDYTNPVTGRIHYAVLRSLRELGLIHISDDAYY